MDLGTIIRRSASLYGGHVAIAIDGREQTYAEMFNRACRLANVLRSLGVQPGDPVAVLGRNSYEALEQIAAFALGNYPRTTLYTYHSADVNEYLIRHVGVKALLVDAEHYRLLQPRLEHLLDPQRVLVFGEGVPEGAQSYERLLSEASADDVVVPCSDDDVHIIRFSSGTTGKPKGIYHTIGRWMQFNNEYRWVTPMMDETSAYLVLGHLAHFGTALLWGALTVGARVVLMSSFDPAAALRLIEEHRVTHAVAVPTMLKAMVNEPESRTRDLSSLKALLYAGSPIDESTLLAAIERFGPVLYQVYAQSEVLLMTTLPPLYHTTDGTPEARRRLRSAGRATPHTILTIRNDKGECLPAGVVGEIAAKSPGCMNGIWNDPEATAARTLPDGSILTRDMGYLDEDGFLYLVDRKDDMIISGGYNIWPSELEEVLAEHPGVADVCVIGVPSERWGETPKALVVPRPGMQPTPEELIEYTRIRVGSIKKITSVEFVDQLPRSETGKLLRSKLREQYWKGKDRMIGGS